MHILRPPPSPPLPPTAQIKVSVRQWHEQIQASRDYFSYATSHTKKIKKGKKL